MFGSPQSPSSYIFTFDLHKDYGNSPLISWSLCPPVPNNLFPTACSKWSCESLRQKNETSLLSLSMDLTTHISKIIQYLSFCDWVIFFCILSSEFIHVVAYLQKSPPLFLRLKNITLHVQTTFHLSTHPSMDTSVTTWVTVYLSATVSNADISISVQVSLWDSAFSPFGSIPRSGIGGSCRLFYV